MRIARWTAIIASAFVLLAAGCRTAPLYNVIDAPVVSSKANPSLEDVGKAIQRAGAALGWHMTQTKPDHVAGTLNLRSHLAVVDIPYNAKSYSIVYKESVALNYDGTNIHSNYNSWIQNLDRAIKIQLNHM